ncbi:MAG: hypothetical protein QMD10_10185 [Desulfitobacteriaceae bacterium]|nr:hypothetical protein [Desulfitobacteriaceae bacterium]
MLKAKNRFSRSRPSKFKPGKIKMPAVVEILTARIRSEVDRDAGIARLKQALAKELKKAGSSPNAAVSLEHIWRADLTLGRSTAYYALEEEVLMADLPYVAAEHNLRLIQTEIERRRQKIAWKIAKNFPPLKALPEDERHLAMYLAGAVPPAPKRPVPLPTEAVKYAVVVKSNKEDRDHDPDEEIMEAMEGWKRFYTDEDVKKASIAEAGSIQPGGHLNICYGSS